MTTTLPTIEAAIEYVIGMELDWDEEVEVISADIATDYDEYIEVVTNNRTWSVWLQDDGRIYGEA